MNIKNWFTGIVEDVNDPLQQGRVRVRCMNYHNGNISELPTEKLPWATCIMPVTSAGVSGIGQSPTGLVAGSWVLGFFRDEDDLQDPIVIGSISTEKGYEIGYSQNVDVTPSFYSSGESLNLIPTAASLFGFSDPHGTYPLRTGADLPDSSTTSQNAFSRSFYAKNNASLNIAGVGVADSVVESNLSSFENAPPSVPLDGSLRSKIVAVAKSQAGSVVEAGTGSSGSDASAGVRGGKNDAPGIREYWNHLGSGKPPLPYCAAFVSWVLFKAGLDTSKLPKTASSQYFLTWAKKNLDIVNLIVNPTGGVKAGDIIVWSHGGGYGHVGLASGDSDASGRYLAIDGNTSSGAGDGKQGVFEKTKSVRGAKAVISWKI
jgi:hypothetical protein